MHSKLLHLTICTLALFAIFLLGAASISHDDSESPDKKTTEVSKEAALKAFDKFKAMEGEWTGKSTMGWDAVLTYRVIASSSVVMEILDFEAHPDETMVTMYHMDGDKLMLTHYCAAKNQPRMVVKEISEDGTNLRFEFLDGTNLPSRDSGHMDKAIYNFVDNDHYSSKWTWYQDGNEKWMEEIVYERKK